jgi:hypothetical protein
MATGDHELHLCWLAHPFLLANEVAHFISILVDQAFQLYDLLPGKEDAKGRSSASVNGPGNSILNVLCHTELSDHEWIFVQLGVGVVQFVIEFRVVDVYLVRIDSHNGSYSGQCVVLCYGERLLYHIFGGGPQASSRNVLSWSSHSGIRRGE